MSRDSHRFADDSAKRIGSSYGVYGGGITPGVALKSATGVVRGEELFHRPELIRPWRTASAQRHAESIVEKEQEIEVLTRKCTELRAQLAGASRELQKSYATHKMDTDKMRVGLEAEIAALKQEVHTATKSKEDALREVEHKMSLMRAEHEAQIAILNKKLQLSSDIANEMSASYMSQMNEVKQSAAREVELIQRLSQARASELTGEIEAANESAKRVSERAIASTLDIQAEMSRNEERIGGQLRQQELRFEALRKSMQSEKTEAERQRDKAVADYAALNEKMKGLSSDLTQTEGCFRDWNVRVLADLEQIGEFYSSFLRDIEGRDVVAPPSSVSVQVSSAFIPNRLSGEPDCRRVLESVADAVHKLTWIKQHHSTVTQNLLKRLKMAEGAGKPTNANSITVEAHEYQFNRLVNEVLESKAHQARLESAMREVKDSFADVESKMTSCVTRLNFFSSNLADAVASPTNCVTPPRGIVTFVGLCVEGAAALWEVNPAAASEGLLLLNRCLRAHLASYGGYECVGEGDAMLFAFGDTIAAYKFAAEAHVWALGLPWPQALMNHYHACVEHSLNGPPRVLFRGLRLQTGIHLGETGIVPSLIPTPSGDGRCAYFGKVINQTIHLTSISCGGQILVSADVAAILDRNLAIVGHPSILPFGDRRIGSHTREAQTLTLMHVTPQVLSGRVFHENPFALAQTDEVLAPTFSATRKLILDNELSYLRSRYDVLQRSVEAMDCETERVSHETEALAVRLRDARISTRPYTAADGVAHAGAIDRLNSRCELIKDDVKRSVTLQQELTEWLRNLEDSLTNYSRAAVTEDDLKRKLAFAQQRASEKMYDLAKASDAKLFQLRTALSSSENANAELREQLSRPQSAVPLVTPKGSTRLAVRPQSPSARL